MTFRPQQFRAVIINDQPQAFDIFLKKLLCQFKGNTDSVFMIRLIAQIAAILKDHHESPIIKFKTIKIIMHLLIMGEASVYDLFQQEIYPILRNACLYNRSHPLSTRGVEFFKNNKYNAIATHQEKIKIQSLGSKFIVFCLECVFTLASWFSKDPKNKLKQSAFSSTYKFLLKQNVVFPLIHDFTYFTEQRITQIQHSLKRCDQQIKNEPFDGDSDYFTSLRSKADAQMMNGVEYLQQKVKQKQKAIQQLKSQLSKNDLERQLIIERQKQQENHFIGRVMTYEQRINELTQQIRESKQLLKNFDHQELTMRQNRINQLEKIIDSLTAQNKQLKRQIQSKSQFSFVSHSNLDIDQKMEKSKNQKSNNGLKLLLELQKEPKEFVSTKSSRQKQHFFQYRETRDCFYPFFDSLSKQQRIRFKKSLLKQKQVLHKTKQLEVGTYSILISQIQIELTVIITNLHDRSLHILDNCIDHPKQVQIVRQSISRKRLKSNEQFKEVLRITINDIDSRCIIMLTEYQYESGPVEKLVLILPVAKIKLFKPLTYTSQSAKYCVNLERLVVFQRRILGSIQKIAEYFPKCFVSHQKTVSVYNLKFQLLEATFFLSVNLVGESLRLNMSFSQADRCLAQKILNQLMFVLGK